MNFNKSKFFQIDNFLSFLEINHTCLIFSSTSGKMNKNLAQLRSFLQFGRNFTMILLEIFLIEFFVTVKEINFSYTLMIKFLGFPRTQELNEFIVILNVKKSYPQKYATKRFFIRNIYSLIHQLSCFSFHFYMGN